MSEQEDLLALISSAALVFVGTVLSSVSGLLERIVIGRILGPEEYGVVSVCIAVVTLASTVCMLGLTQGIPRYTSRFDESHAKRGIWASGAVVALTASTIASVVLITVSEQLSSIFLGSVEYQSVFVVFILSIPFVTLLGIVVSAIRGQENTRFKSYSQDLLYPFSRILILIGLLFAGFGAQAAAFAYLGGSFLAFAAAHALLNRIQPLWGPVTWRFSELLKFSTPLIVSMMMAILLTRTDTIMLGYFRSATEVGLYSAAYPVAAGLQIVLTSFGFLYLPLASRLDADGNRPATEAMYELTTKWIFILTFPAFVILVVFPGEILRLFWGDEFVGAALVLVILSIGFFSSVAAGRNRETISAIGYPKYVMYANSLAFIGNFVMNLYLIPQFGAVGAAVSSAISFLLLNLVVYAVLNVLFDISPFSKYSVRAFLLLPITLIPLGYCISKVSMVPSSIVLALLPILGLITIFVITMGGCLQAEDQVAIEMIEEKANVSIPYIREKIPPKHS